MVYQRKWRLSQQGHNTFGAGTLAVPLIFFFFFFSFDILLFQMSSSSSVWLKGDKVMESTLQVNLEITTTELIKGDL